MTISLEQLGINVEGTSPLRAFPSFVIYSDSGCGKSTQMAEAAQDALFIKTSRTTTRPYYSMLRAFAPEEYVRAWCEWVVHNAAYSTHESFREYADQAGLDAAGKKLNLKSKLNEFTLPSNVNNWAYLNDLKTQLITAKAMGHRLPVSGIVGDEWTEIMRRVYGEMQQSGVFKSKSGKNNEWAVQDGAEEWLINFTNDFRDHGLLLGMVCQEAKPVYHEGTTKIKYKGGPEAPIGRLRETICRAPDIVLRITLEAGNVNKGMGGATAAGVPPPPPPPPVPGVPPPAPVAATLPPPPPPPTGAQVALVAAPQKNVVLPTKQEFLELFSKLPQGIAPPPLLDDTTPERWAIRKFWTEAHPEWNTKFRDFTVSYRENLGLRRLLERAGYL